MILTSCERSSGNPARRVLGSSLGNLGRGQRGFSQCIMCCLPVQCGRRDTFDADAWKTIRIIFPHPEADAEVKYCSVPKMARSSGVHAPSWARPWRNTQDCKRQESGKGFL